jgi:hypothetical protein
MRGQLTRRRQNEELQFAGLCFGTHQFAGEKRSNAWRS